MHLKWLIRFQFAFIGANTLDYPAVTLLKGTFQSSNIKKWVKLKIVCFRVLV